MFRLISVIFNHVVLFDIKLLCCSCIVKSFIIEIMPEVKLGPEAQPRDANNRGVLFLLDT